MSCAYPTPTLPQLELPRFQHSIRLARWCHLGVDVLWLLNEAIFYMLLFAIGLHRKRQFAALLAQWYPAEYLRIQRIWSKKTFVIGC